MLTFSRTKARADEDRVSEGAASGKSWLVLDFSITVPNSTTTPPPEDCDTLRSESEMTKLELSSRIGATVTTLGNHKKLELRPVAVQTELHDEISSCDFLSVSESPMVMVAQLRLLPEQENVDC